MKHLIRLINDIQIRYCSSSKLPFTDDLKNRLQSLTALEKHLIADSIYKLEYDIGSGPILKILHETGVISIEYYISGLEDTDLLLNIYNEFLENQPYLFAELVKCSYQLKNPNSVRLKAILDEFMIEFVQNINGLKLNPFKALSKHLPYKTKIHLDENLIKHFLKNDAISIQKALKEQHLWESEDKLQGNSIQDIILRDSLMEYEKIVPIIHQCICVSNETNFRIYFKILRILARKYGLKFINFYRQILTDDFRVFIKEKNDFVSYFVIVSIRQLSFSASDCFKYNDWYKKNIGEMMYLISKEEFQYVLRSLMKMTEYEGNKEFLEIHINTRIQAPVKCNELVFTYKALLKSRLESLAENKTNVIVLDC
uniref:CSON010143 protein n=1 Tax=Culicoides sonorensis TaxID=179676 RepID=A0A336KAV6_CULSO